MCCTKCALAATTKDSWHPVSINRSRLNEHDNDGDFVVVSRMFVVRAIIPATVGNVTSYVVISLR